MSKPGVMLYWPTFDALEKMSDGNAKAMMKAIRNYAQNGETPSFETDSLLDVIWTIIKPSIDADDERYNNNSLARKYAVYCRECNRREEKPLSREEWEKQKISFDIE